MVKGAAGQAIQNMNLLFGLRIGLKQVPSIPRKERGCAGRAETTMRKQVSGTGSPRTRKEANTWQEQRIIVREMTRQIDKVYELWMSIQGFGIRSIDDSRGRGQFLSWPHHQCGG